MYSPQSERHYRGVAYLITLATVLSQSVGEVTIAPRNTESKVGDRTYFNCSTDLEFMDIFWYHGDKYMYIYYGHEILEPYHGRFEIDRNASKGSHNLVIHSVEASDAGEYICIDDDGSGTRRSAELVVLDNDPVCQSNIQPDGVIGQNVFNIPLDEVQLTCTVGYHGNILPQLEWKKVGDNSSLKDISTTSIVTSTNRVISTLKLKGDISLDKSFYVCQTRRSTRNINCTPEIIKVLYFVNESTIVQNVVRGEQMTCMATNNTFPCISQWYHDNYTCPLSCDETITAHLLGEYRCTVRCHVRGRDYYFEVLKVFVVEPISSSFLTNAGVTVTAVVVPIAIIITMAVLIYGLVSRHRRKKFEQDYTPQINDDAQVLYMIDSFSNYGLASSALDVDEKEIELLYKIQKETSIGRNRIVAAVTLDRMLFIAGVNTSEIEAYDLDNFDPSGKPLQVNTLSSTFDMCASKKNKCLYIMNNKKFEANDIMKINKTGKVLKKWLMLKNGVGNLSATIEGNVIVAVHDINCVIEYSHDGVLLNKIDLGLHEFIDLSHAMKIDDGHYAICQGVIYNNTPSVCIVDKNGDVLSSFGDENGSEETQLYWPAYLAIANDGSMIVADILSNRLLRFDSALTLEGNIVPKNKQKFRGPRMIFLDDAFLVVVIVAGGLQTQKDGAQTEGGGNSEDTVALLRRVEEGYDATQEIEENCKVLVFDSKKLMK